MPKELSPGPGPGSPGPGGPGGPRGPPSTRVKWGEHKILKKKIMSHLSSTLFSLEHNTGRQSKNRKCDEILHLFFLVNKIEEKSNFKIEKQKR